MVSLTAWSMSGGVKALAASSVSVLVFLSLYHHVIYEVASSHNASAAEVAYPVSSQLHTSTAIVDAETVATSLKSIFKEPSLSATQTPAATTSPPETADHHDEKVLGAIVAAAMTSTDVSWMSELADSWDLFPYTVDDPLPPPELQIPQNKGHEAMVYLTFIINNWTNLPARVIFVHGHRNSWHQEGDIVDLVRSLRLPALEAEGYIPLRCDWYPSCPKEMRPVTHDAVTWGPGVHREDAERAISDAWETLFPQVPIPETIASQCCAQFAVTRSAIQRRQKADYERMRQWIIDTDLIDDVSGRVLEKLWAYIMTHETIRCPPPQQCACNYFGQCGNRDWPVPPEGLAKWPSE